MTYIGEPYDESYYHTFSLIRPEGYHDYTRPTFVSVLRGFADDIEMITGPVSGKRVLDIGCAYGYSTDELALRGADVSGFDLSTWAISQANARFPTRDFIQGDYLTTGFSDNTFDLTVVIGIVETIDNNPETMQFLLELLRITKQEGSIYILIDYNSGPSPIYVNRTAGEWQVAIAGGSGPRTIDSQDVGHLPLYYATRVVVT